MIKHVVLFKIKEVVAIEEKQNILDELKDKLLALKDVINELKFIEVGTHYTLQSQSFDICLITHFDTLEDLGKYKIHPEHKKVLDYILVVTADRVAVDFEF